MENSNISKFAQEMSELVNQKILEENVHPSKGRSYYIQPPKAGSPMLLHHYRGPFCIDMNPEDFSALQDGKISAHDYITSANWQVGYFWGGIGMLGGGYYQPIDIIGRKDEVRRYLQILSCRGYNHSSGYMPPEKDCLECCVSSCPFSRYKEGDWEAELEEHDPRLDLFKALYKRFGSENPGYVICGFSCYSDIPENEIWLEATSRYPYDSMKGFMAYASSSVIRSLLMHETSPENWEEYAEHFEFYIRMFGGELKSVTEENLKKAHEHDEPKASEMSKFIAFLKRMFS